MKNLVFFALYALLGPLALTTYADEGHSHGTEAEQPSHAEMKQDDHAHGHGEAGGHHQHDEWIDPPAAYGEKVSAVWADIKAIGRGQEIYQQQCVACHGVDGKGTGPMAPSLAHAPADLTNNFHTSPGNGDAYLFWRVSEGGTVEPFKSQNSAMPAFKGVLNEEERWYVLAYIHTFFHQGLINWGKSAMTGDAKPSDGSGS